MEYISFYGSAIKQIQVYNKNRILVSNTQTDV